MCLGSLEAKSRENIFAKLAYLVKIFVGEFLAIKSAI